MGGAATGFSPERLHQVREARGLTLVALADLVGVSSSAISQYEKGATTPRQDTAGRLASALNVPLPLMFQRGVVRPSSPVFWRSMSTPVKHARVRLYRRYEWFKEIVAYLEQYVDFPENTVPERLTGDFRDTKDEAIEELAQELRDLWQLGQGPIPNMTNLIEANGVLVSRGQAGSEHLDAMSEFDKSGKAFVFLSSDKNTLVRTRFDVGHELFHLIAHRQVDQKSIANNVNNKILEKQAHRFSAAFQLPARSFTEELWDVSLDSFRSLKARWKVSIACMVFRAVQLKLIDEDQAKRMRINITRRDWRRTEPLDDLPVERPTTIASSFELLISEGVKTPEQILTDLNLPATDLIELAGLRDDFFFPSQTAGPVLKRADNVLSFSR